MKKGRKENKSPMRVELERAKLLKAEGIKKELDDLRRAIVCVNLHSTEIILGIKVEKGSVGVSTLKSWVSALNLPQGYIFAFDDTGNSAEVKSFDNVASFIKYNSSCPDKTYLQPYKSDGYNGVLFQPVVSDRIFRQYGDLPAKLF